MASYDLFDAFNDCVDRLNAGQSLEDCLRAHPQHAERLRPLLETALLVQRARPAIPPGAQARVRAQVLRAAPPSATRFRFVPSGLALAAASVLVIAFVLAMVLMNRRAPGPSLRPELTMSPSATASPTLADTATVAPSATPTTPAPTATVTASATATATITATATVTTSPSPTPTHTAPTVTTAPARACTFTVVPTSINLRSGPGTGYAIVGYGFSSEVFTVIARHTSGLWFQIARTQGEAWVAASVGMLGGDCATLPMLDTPLREGAGAVATVTPVPGGGAPPSPPGGAVSPTPDDDEPHDGEDDGGHDDGGDSKDDDSHDKPDDD
jgi:hypothetical protein